MMTKIILSILFIISCVSCSKTNHHTSQINESIVPALNVPFGTIVPMEVKIIDGDSYHIKATEGSYLLEISSINNKTLNEKITLNFQDESGKLASDNFEFYEILYNKKAEIITEDTIKIIKNNFVGKTYKINTYESGSFVGIPDDYNKYSISQGTKFHFQSYLIILKAEEK
ncbi:hypothetical protein [Chryseobacterium sp. EO14]|uniref:hypothetical protein n=1 Tax=Chryseobacterium sp. EO14 TaxID=2950551 RepID=UPI0021097D17|nr:hypothetical protein [Chryseobacterium sp. EO14]MCQ4141792.1 hypothetical protein [Chryseobacterium sp. EO14]